MSHWAVLGWLAFAFDLAGLSGQSQIRPNKNEATSAPGETGGTHGESDQERTGVTPVAENWSTKCGEGIHQKGAAGVTKGHRGGCKAGTLWRRNIAQYLAKGHVCKLQD